MITVKDSIIRKSGTRLVIGYDLRPSFAQISYLTGKDAEPETIPYLAGTEQYDIPAVLARRKDNGQWLYGKEAEDAPEEEVFRVRDLLSKAERGEEIPVGEEKFDPVALLSLFVRRSLGLLAAAGIPDHFDSFMFTVENLTPRTVEVLGRVKAAISGNPESITCQSHMESFYHYMMHRDPELLQGGAMCFELEPHLKTMHFTVNLHTVPKVCMIEKAEYPEFTRFLKPDPPVSEKNRKDSAFADLLRGSVFPGKDLRSVYLLGDGFSGEWMSESLKVLCARKRAFQGSNLFGKGAAFAALERLSEPEENPEYVYLGEDKLKSNIGLYVKERGEDSYFAALDAGENWFEAKKDFQMILTGGSEIEFFVTPMTGTGAKRRIISLEGLPEREKKTTMLLFHLEMTDAHTLNVDIEDLGFGEIVKASGLAWSHSIKVE
ncbi:MAG: hypothetical protein K6F53_12995 [Lachnospiraceae bacterium]|nr:hypothetical protein [Lachnospiraceae bacterium]